MKIHSAEKVISFGAGVIGTSWTIAFLRAGYNVMVYDVDDLNYPRLRQTVERELSGLGANVALLCSRLAFTTSLEEGVQGAIYGQENIPENKELKRSFYEAIDRYASPDLIVASSTSGIPGSAFMLDLGISSQCLVAHPANPPHLIPLVELCPTVQTDSATVEKCEEFLTEIGQYPIRVQKEIDGFILNRLQSALLAEAMYLVSCGYVTPADLDCVVKFGLGLRWAFMGPFETAHLNASGGFNDYMDKFREHFQHEFDSIGGKVTLTDQLIECIATVVYEQVPTSRIADAQFQRNRKIAALRQHLATAEL